MKAIIIDDDEICLEVESSIINSVEQIESLESFTSVTALIDYMSENVVDIAFLDIIMAEADGITLAMEIKRLQPDCHIIFVSGSRDYALEAFQVFASGYLLKPLTKEDIETMLLHL